MNKGSLFQKKKFWKILISNIQHFNFRGIFNDPDVHITQRVKGNKKAH